MSEITVNDKQPTFPLIILSQLYRLGHEQGLTEEKLKHLLNTGVLARVFKSENIQGVNLVALERVLGIREQLPEVIRPILVKRHLSISQLVDLHSIITYSDRHKEIVAELSRTDICLQTVLTQLERPSYGRIQRSQESRGVRSADLRELITFMYKFNVHSIGTETIVALGTRTRCRNSDERPEVFFAYYDPSGSIHLKHCSSYSSFSNNCKFLGVLKEG